MLATAVTESAGLVRCARFSDIPVPAQSSRAEAGSPILPVCVIVPALNRATMLPRSLASVWSQRPYLPAQLIVVDDGSDDDTAEVANALGADVIRHPTNRGLAAARNSGLDATACQWAAFLDSDDEWLPGHLEHLWRLRGGHALVGSAALYCAEDPGQDRFHGPVTRKPIVLSSPGRIIATYNVFTASACMIRRDVAVELGGFRPIWGVEDFDLWVRVLERYTGICSPRVTVIYHVHAAQMSAKAEEMLRGHRAVGESHCARSGASPAVLRRWEGVAAWDRMRAALAARRRRAALASALAVLRGRQRLVGVVLLLWSRWLGRRSTSRVGRDGQPTVALVLCRGRTLRAVIDGMSGRTVRDLSTTSTLRALVTLARRPAGLVVVGSRRHATLLRLIGIEAVAGEPALSDRRSKG